MCTVTFLPLKNNNFILTSNRDEQRLRETLPPKKYVENGVEMVFPKDKTAGGTWIGTSSKNRLICVLNGAFKKHVKKKKYKKSRGVIAKEILKEDDFLQYVERLDLKGIEPFTMIIIDWNKGQLNLYELIWDETKKYFNKLKNEAKIWSSSTLYSNTIKEKRKQWFHKWVSENEFTSEAILNFHHSENGDKEQSVLMKRSYVETVSITSVKKERDLIEMQYADVVHNQKSKYNYT
ncbi:NRDE family protein [Lutibacter sp.]|uniref:NRDE family protein n=1 Tax=Lutibacter sp. TaxID=1925666 RepID=UPI0025BED6FD|nr:NRDE family protein [Lutibacter sp.]MCF6168882.1 NRDE family protein [Lutibacter sp.]